MRGGLDFQIKRPGRARVAAEAPYMSSSLVTGFSAS
jgi:hypothetical protein